MILPKENKIESCCAHPKMFRAKFEVPFIDGANIIATDGRVMAIVPITRDEGDADLCRVPIDAIKASRKLPNNSIACNGSFRLSNGATYPDDPDAGELPAYKHAIPAGPTTYRALINVGFLRRVCEAIDAEQVILEFTGESGAAAPIRVIPVTGAARGYMMTEKAS